MVNIFLIYIKITKRHSYAFKNVRSLNFKSEEEKSIMLDDEAICQ